MSINKDKSRPSVAGKKVVGAPAPGPAAPAPSAPAPKPAATPALKPAKTRPSVSSKKVAESTQPHPGSAAAPMGDGEAEPTSGVRTSGAATTGTPRMAKSASAVRAKKARSRKVLYGLLAAVIVLVVALGALVWNQWLRFDDAADIQGTWKVDGTDVVITINESDMVMTGDVSYPYTLDTFNKTIDFSFQQYSGHGSYAFNDERNQFIITETDADTGETVNTKLDRQ